MAVRWDRIDRKLAVIQALLVDLIEDLAVLRTQMEAEERQRQGEEPVAEKKVQRKLRKGEKVELK